jgi:YesN/AraC family two-component response regulator
VTEEVFFAPKGVFFEQHFLHEYKNFKKVDILFVSVTLYGGDFFEKLLFGEVITLTNARSIFDLIIKNGAENKPKWLREITEEHLLKVLLGWCLQANIEQSARKKRLALKLPFMQEKRLHDLWEFTEKNYASELNSKILASVVGLSELYFGQFLKNAVGFNPVDFIEHFRMEKATELLKNENLTVADVAKAVGYSEQAYFGRRFKKFFGKTPGAVRTEIIKNRRENN